MENSYLQEAAALSFGLPPKDELMTMEGPAFRALLDRHITARDRLVARYAWAIPDAAALRLLAAHSPLVEIGAGTGYWAALLRSQGVDIVAYDQRPPVGEDHHNLWHRGPLGVGTCWTDVQQGTPKVLQHGQHAERTLFLCWPPITTMANRALRLYQGSTCILIGYEAPGCTGDAAFYDRLHTHWTLDQTLALPNWDRTEDKLMVWSRKGQAR